MSDEARYLRAREVLDGAGWLFDALKESETRAWMQTAFDEKDRRELHYQRARFASEMRVTLERIIGEYESDMKMQEIKESRNGRREHAAG